MGRIGQLVNEGDPALRRWRVGACVLAIAAFAGAFAGIALRMEWAALLAALVAWPSLIRLAAASQRPRLLPWLVGLSFPIHLLLMTSIHLTLIAIGRDGFVTGDDFGYYDLSWRLAQHIRGADVPINWSAEGYLINSYFVQFETAIFYIIGSQVLAVQVMNAAFLHLAGILSYDIGARLFGARAGLLGAALVLGFPSVSLWGVLNLKDAPALLLIVIVLRQIVQYSFQPRAWSLIAAISALIVLQGVRLYVFLLLALLIPIGVALSARAASDLPRRAPHFLASVVVCGLLMAMSGSGFLGLDWVRIDTFANLEQSRAWMGAGARTRIVEAGQSVIARPGDRFLVVTEGAQPTGPTPAPRVIVVQPFTRLVLEGQGGGDGRTVEVRPNDIVVIDGGESSGAPRPLVVGAQRKPAPELRTDDSLDPRAIAQRTLSYLPTGAAFAFFAPFPWETRSMSERFATAEMPIWYAVLAAASATLWRSRHALRDLAPLWLYVAGIFTIFILVEGNVGTLFRHRAMAIPVVCLIASPSLILAWERLRRRPASP